MVTGRRMKAGASSLLSSASNSLIKLRDQPPVIVPLKKLELLPLELAG